MPQKALSKLESARHGAGHETGGNTKRPTEGLNETLSLIGRYTLEIAGLKPGQAKVQDHGQDIRLACAIGIPFGIYFSIFNLLHGYTELGIIEGLAILFLLPPAYFLSRLSGWKLILAESMVMLCVISIFLALFHYGGIHDTGLYWIFSLPLTAFYVTSQFRGWLWSLALLSMTWVIPPVSGFTRTHLVHFQLALVYYTAISASFNLLRSKFATELRNLTIELATALGELKQTQVKIVQTEKLAAVGQLVAGFAHEVNNTVNFVSGALPPLGRRLNELKALLRDLTSDEKPDQREKAENLLRSIDRLLGNIQEGARRTSKIVTDLKNFSRPDDDQHLLLDINHEIESTLSLVTPEYWYKMEVIRELSPDRPLVSGSKTQLNQVFMNMILNAFQACPDKGQLLIRTFSDGGNTHILFKDNGPGIPQEAQGRLFEPFFSTKKPGEGTGLGLSISYGIIRKHEGEIVVRSEPGQGSEFEIILPQQEKDNEQA